MMKSWIQFKVGIIGNVSQVWEKGRILEDIEYDPVCPRT